MKVKMGTLYIDNDGKSLIYVIAIDYMPHLNGKSRILEVSLGLFCSIIYISFGAVLFIYITKSVFVPPFDSFESLVANTKYNVISLKGSTGAIAFKVSILY